MSVTVKENRGTEVYDAESNSFMELLADLGDALRPLLQEQDIVATELAGLVPFKVKATSIDMLGLCDRVIATHGEHQESLGKRFLGYVIGQAPDFYLFLSAQDVVPLWRHPDFAPRQHDYHVVVTENYLRFKNGEPPILIVRHDFHRLSELLHHLGAHTVRLEDELRRLGHLQSDE